MDATSTQGTRGSHRAPRASGADDGRRDDGDALDGVGERLGVVVACHQALPLGGRRDALGAQEDPVDHLVVQTGDRVEERAVALRLGVGKPGCEARLGYLLLVRRHRAFLPDFSRFGAFRADDAGCSWRFAALFLVPSPAPTHPRGHRR